jgi:hypothetical protein
MLQIQNRNNPIGKGIYTENHFYTNSPNPPLQHPFDERLIQAEELFYDVFRLKFGEKAQTKKGSGFRTKSDSNYTSTSQHSIGRARDCNWSDQTAEKYIVAVLCHDFATQGVFFQALFNLGFRGFGRYETFFHIDTRINGGSSSFGGTPYSKWSKRPNYSSDAQLHQAFLSQHPEALEILGNRNYEQGALVKSNIIGDSIKYIAAGLKSFSPTKEDGYNFVSRRQQLISVLSCFILIVIFYWLFQSANK